MDNLLRYAALRDRGKINRAQLHWFLCFYSSCIKFTEPPNWLTKELNQVLDAKEPFFAVRIFIWL